MKLIGVALIGVLGYALYTSFTAPTPQIGDKTVKYDKPKITLLHKEKDAEAIIHVDNEQGAHLADLLLDRDGIVYPYGDTTLKVHVEPRSSFIRPTTDLGAWTALSFDKEDNVKLGLRYSPVRFLNDSLAAEGVISKEAVGVGASFYLSKYNVGPTLNHVGLGCWYVTRFDGTWSGPAFGITFSTF